jgi:hypothetical protein
MENQIINDMKRILMKLSMAAFLLMPVLASAQKKSDPAGSLTYCLPSTGVSIQVEAVQEKFFAGPYAKYAEKYLGVKPRQKDESTFQLTQIKMVPSVEADQSKRYTVTLDKGVIETSALKLSSCGLISFGDAAMGGETVWRFPVESSGDFAGKGVLSNLTSEATVLYKNQRNQSAYNKVSVQQNMIVAKSAEQKAAETAEMILNLRKQRLQIVTGDTDATYSGEAMGAAIDELTRLENEYMTLFMGYSEYQTQTMNFEVIPEADRETQRYIAFRLSDTAGLVPADNLSGKPVVMEFIPQEFQQVEEPVVTSKKTVPVVSINYRIPAICTVKLIYGVDVLLQSRIPVYQLGQESSMPVNVILK